jgi:hypothetical protein
VESKAFFATENGLGRARLSGFPHYKRYALTGAVS